MYDSTEVPNRLQTVECWLPGARRRWECGHFLFGRYRVSVWEEEKVLEMDGDDDCTPM